VKIGFTGTRDGMTANQHWLVWWYLAAEFSPTEFHHGDCIGADAEADEIARSLGITRVAHPSNLRGMRAHCDAEIVLPVKPPLVRNRDIVAECDVILATPKTAKVDYRSGTWTTIRYAHTPPIKRVMLFTP
jgi:hypothetical protein